MRVGAQPLRTRMRLDVWYELVDADGNVISEANDEGFLRELRAELLQPGDESDG